MTTAELLSELGETFDGLTPARREALLEFSRIDIAAALRQAITADGRSHEAIAKAAGPEVTTIIIDRFMDGTEDITLSTAGKIATALGLVLAKPKPSTTERL